MKPPPQGILHCQKYAPVTRGDLNANVIVVCGPDVHGETEQRLALSGGDAIGTFTLMLGIENVCATLQPDQALIMLAGLPLTSATPPMVPVTLLQKLFRSGVQPS